MQAIGGSARSILVRLVALATAWCACGEGGDGSSSASPSSGAGGVAASEADAPGAGAALQVGAPDQPDAGGETISPQQACRRFAEVNCRKAESCGLVLGEIEGGLLCLQCNTAALQLIEQPCLQLITEPVSRPAVDQCLAEIEGQSCDEACGGGEILGCDVFAALEGEPEPVVDGGPAGEGSEPLCDPLCQSP